ncbi:MAG: GyrI-like domain-containing protein [Thermodesulfobacteriota bacterium]
MEFSSRTLLKNEYIFRLNRAIDYIQDHYSEDLNLTGLAGIACFSKYHFHRLFRELTGETVTEFLRRIRLEKAAVKLILETDKDITEIALDCGFSSSQNFARSFKKYSGITPSSLRREFNWDSVIAQKSSMDPDLLSKLPPTLVDLFRSYEQKKTAVMERTGPYPPFQVEIKEVPSIPVAYVRHQGPYQVEGVRGAFGKLMKWAIPRGLFTENSLVIGVVWSSPSLTPQKNLLYDACLTVPEGIQTDRGVNLQTLPGGKYAIHHCEIDPEAHEEEWLNLVLNWLASSGYQPDARPAYDIYYNDFETHPQKKVILDLCFPVKPKI